ncbi:MAG: hypothetical protein EAZ54_10705 [Curvibacter sp.]|nr:MAG: hypothetical protein EAZ54_10705 [Curvibacter sp.]
MLIGSILLAALAVFIIWDSRRLRNIKPDPIAREAMESGFAPGGIDAWKLPFGLALVSAFLGVSEWLEPKHPPFTGRWSFISTYAYSIVGEKGPALLSFGVTFVLLSGALALWRGKIRKF